MEGAVLCQRNKKGGAGGKGMSVRWGRGGSPPPESRAKRIGFLTRGWLERPCIRKFAGSLYMKKDD